MLTGEFRHTLDSKGRVFVPAKFRDDFGEKVVLAKSATKFVAMYPVEEWARFMEKLELISETRDISKVKRFYMQSAMPTEIDSQGRICICKEHREFAGLEKNISFIGMTKYVEIWNADILDVQNEAVDMEEIKSLSRELHLGLY